tara:strand:- start:4746 stop:5927 length:1182 start_codon:yes stop_codon:yes gene_type:complete
LVIFFQLRKINLKMKIFYWSPFLSNIATIDAVVNSVRSISMFDKKNFFKPSIIDSTGEWLSQKNKTNNLHIINLYNKEYYSRLPKGGYLKSRISQILIFILSFKKLKKLLKKEEPEFLIAHLIISLPLFIFTVFNLKTKLIIRISGTPKLNFLRRIFWSMLSKNIEIVTCPTKKTHEKLKNLKIFPEHKLRLLYDPVLSFKTILKRKKESIDNLLEDKSFILSVGRLTKQKNFSLLIKSFKEFSTFQQDLKLVIIGEGEERLKLENYINELNLKDKVFLLGFKNNIFNYISRSKLVISSSLYEDPGFFIIEAGSLNKIVIAADSGTGPSEILDNSKRGFLFINNDYKSLIEKIHEFNETNEKDLFKKKMMMKKYCKNFTFFSHFLKLKKILLI